VIDLHTHSTISDGSDGPERIPELAHEAGCSAVALTDHDSLAGVARAGRRAKELGIGFVPGCEVSCRPVGPGGMHVLIYFVEDDGSPLCEELVRLRADRRVRNIALAERLAGLGLPLTYDMVVEEADGEEGIGRPHFATVMVRLGAADSVDHAFERYLGNDRPGFVSKSRLTAEEVADLATSSGGVAVLAHPFSNGLAGVELASLIARLAEAGVAGMEVTYGRYSLRQRTELSNLARRFDLVATGGSDYHGRLKPDLAVGTGRGDLKVPDKVLAQLESRRPA
jgi:predicted metal-dependent phosphoesterase TrpH